MSFRTTRWTVVRAASHAPESERRAALATLCASYWPAVYAFLRRQGTAAGQAEELTQAFFARLIERDGLRDADPERGRFRSFLLGALRNFLAGEHDRSRTLKRGGAVRTFSLDEGVLHSLEEGLAFEPAAPTSPEREFERAWARAVLERARRRLAEEQEEAGKGAQWRALEPFLAAADERGHGAALAVSLGLSENALRVALHRLRRRFGELVRDEVRETVGPGEVEDEVRVLLSALG
jgi:RNA polymerase sigma-70 factor (ECF subfamily)